MIKRLSIIILVLAIVAGGILIIKKKRQALNSVPPPKRLPVSVEVVEVDYGQFPKKRRFLGTIRAKVQANISARLTSYIIQVLVREGDMVKKGQLLALLDSRLERQQVQGLQAEVEAAKTFFATQDAIYQRDKMLFSKKALSKEALDRSKSARDSALARLLSLQKTLSSAKTNLEYTKIIAPFDGVITNRYMNPGNLATPGKPIVAMEKPSEGYYVEIKLPQKELSSIKPGNRVWLKFVQDHKLEEIACSISRIHPGVDTSGLAVVEADIQQRPFGLPTGSTLQIEIELGKAEGFLLPVRSLLQNVKESFVYAIDSQSMIRILRVRPLFLGESVAVVESSDLKKGMKVVVAQESALLRLHQGQKVKVIEAQDK